MISLKNLTKKYEDNIILESCSIDFANEGITCVFGPSGCGKSTLFNLIAGFDRDYEGDILTDGCDISTLSNSEISKYRKSKIGFIFQEYNLIQGYTVLENIKLAAELNCNSATENEKKALTLIDRLGLSDKQNEKIENLSGGQKQRVSIARALINEPAIILADEPTGALDRNTANEIMELFCEIAREKPIVIITHDEKICNYAHSVITISEGKVKVIKNSPLASNHKDSVRPNNDCGKPKVSMQKRALRNFRNQLRKFIGIAFAVSVGISAVLFSISSQNIISNKIDEFEEKNTAFLYGQIPLEHQSYGEKVEKVLQKNNIDDYYYQYKIPESSITIYNKTVDLNSKKFGALPDEVMNIGVMPQNNEIAITPSIAKKISNDIPNLIGEKLTFSCGSFSKELIISGIFNDEFDNFYLSPQLEQELYATLELQNPTSIQYKVNHFEDVVTIEQQLNNEDILPITASKQVVSFLDSFKQLQTLFFIISLFIAIIALFACILILIRIARMRAKEIGIMMALGYESSMIRKMQLYESLFASGVAVFITLGIMVMSIGMTKFTSLELIFSQKDILFALTSTFVTVSILTIYTGNKLLKTDPAKVLSSY